MKLLVLGAGAIGGYYGARLIEAGADVTFLVREERKKLMESQGLRMVSDSGDFEQKVKLVTSNDLRDKYDLVLLTCKTYDLDSASDSIAPAVSSGASVLPFVNGVGAYEKLDLRFGKDKVLGGVAYIATTLGDDGVIKHLGKLDSLTVGARSGKSIDLAKEFFGAIGKTSGIRIYSDNIDQALWDKWVMLAAGALMCCMMRGTVKEILATRAGERLMNQAIDECSEVAKRAGYPLSENTLNDIRGRLLDRQSPWAASMMRDIDQGKTRLEADGIVGDMLSHAEQFEVSAVLTAAAYTNLQVYSARHGVADKR
ncbi:2-dehydropantoate 2-reductase [Paraburkholderia sp. GAS199]|uniref:ketopantoate reductase family protein n=1 Tax=Paraburkholderia sp. GAS199 TaxID=3035126 RepID=UPI003D1FAA86